MNFDTLSPTEKRALLERMLRTGAGRNAPSRLEDHRQFKALRSRLHVVSRWTDLHPFFKAHQGITQATTRIQERELVNFSTYNYLGLSGHPEVSAAAKEAIDRYGTSSSASRIASGEKELHGELERELAAWLGTEAAIVMVSGHATNVTTIGHLFGRGDLVLHDALSHNSAMEGAALSGARVRAYRHNDLEHLESLLVEHQKTAERTLILTEGVFSMDGDIPDLPALIDLKQRYGAYLMVDEAHSVGVLGATGRGIREHFGIPSNAVDIWMGTLSKSLASCGGYIAGSADLIQYLKYTAPGFVYSVAITPPNAAAALCALRIIQREPERVARLQANARLFQAEARALGFDTHLAMGTAVIPIVTGSSFRAIKLAERLFGRGINVDPVVSPAVEQDKARLRFFVTATHDEREIRSTLVVMAEEIERLPSRTHVVGDDILATLPTRDRADLPSGRITDPGLVFHKRARLVNATTGERDSHFDPIKEDAHACTARALYRQLADGSGVDPAALHPELIVEVPGPAGQAAVGRWRGPDAYERYLEHREKVRPSASATLEYVMAYGNEVAVAGRRAVRQGEEWYLHLLSMRDGRVARVEDVLDGGAWRGSGLPGPEADSVTIDHDPAVAQINARLATEMYDAFVRKSEIEKFIERCAPDARWEVHGPSALPFAGVWYGPDGLLEFWRDLASIMDIHSLWLDATIARGDQIFSLGGFRSTAIPTALAYSDPFLQVATYRAGMLSSFIDYFDPRIDLAAYRPDVYA